MTINVLFVCFGNICRSPSAQAIFQKFVDEEKLTQRFTIDSCGTAAINAGKPADPRAVDAAARRGYNLKPYVARQINEEDYQFFHYIICMDRKNLSSVRPWAPDNYTGEIELLMNYCDNGGNTQVPDPYYQSADQFEEVLLSLERGALGLLDAIKKTHQL